MDQGLKAVKSTDSQIPKPATRARFQRPKPKIPTTRRTQSRSLQPKEPQSLSVGVTEDGLNPSATSENCIEKSATEPINISDGSLNQEKVDSQEFIKPIHKPAPHDSPSDKDETNCSSSTALLVEEISVCDRSNEILENDIDDVGSSESLLEKTPAETSTSINLLSSDVSAANEVRVPSGQLDVLAGDQTDLPPTAPPVSDRAFKYPQLTSLLSKKRAEPKKDAVPKRRKFKKGDAIDKSKLTMADLIYWNPTSKDPGMKKTKVPDNEEHNVDDPVDDNEIGMSGIEEEALTDNSDDVSTAAPRLVLSEDGTINLDHESLVIKRKRPIEHQKGQAVTVEDTTYASFRKRPVSKSWTLKETYFFYKALTIVGTDFALMETIMPNRSRRELKMKFKREEKRHLDLVNLALKSTLSFDAEDMKKEIENLNSGSLGIEFEDQQSIVKVKKPRKLKNDKTLPGTSASANEEDAVIGKDLEPKKGIKRKRKKKILECFVDPDEVESIEDEVTVSSLASQDFPGPNSPDEGVYTESQLAEESDAADDGSTNIEIILMEGSEAKIPSILSGDTTTVMMDESSVDYLPKVIEELVQDNENTYSAPRRKKMKPNLVPKKARSRTSAGSRSSSATKIEIQNESAVNPEPVVDLSVLGERTILVRNVSSNELTEEPMEVIYEEPVEDGIVDCVMANEVVTSDDWPKKVKKKANTILPIVRKQLGLGSEGSSLPSFLNFTPTELAEEIKFSPAGNSKTYLRSPARTPKNTTKLITSIQALSATPESSCTDSPARTPNSNNELITSMQALAATPEQSSSISTSLNRTSNLNFTIPISPEQNSGEVSKPVMLLAQAPDEENVFHFFMYKEKGSKE